MGCLIDAYQQRNHQLFSKGIPGGNQPAVAIVTGEIDFGPFNVTGKVSEAEIHQLYETDLSVGGYKGSRDTHTINNCEDLNKYDVNPDNNMEVRGGVAVTKNILIIPGNILYGLNPNIGGIIWSAPYSLYSFPVIVGNVVYFITYNNFKLYAIEKNTGKELWSYSLKSLPDDGKPHQDGNIMPYNNLLVVGWKQNLVAFH